MKKSKKKETLSKKGTQAQNLTTAERIVGRHCCQFEYAKWQKGGEENMAKSGVRHK